MSHTVADPTAAAADGTPAVADALLAAQRRIQTVMSRMPDLLEAEIGMSSTRLQALSAVDAGATRVQDVAAFCWSSVSTTSRTVDALVHEGLLDRRPEPGNRRALLLSLTGDGQDVMARVDRWRRRLVAGLVAEVGEEQAERFAEILERFADALSRQLA